MIIVKIYLGISLELLQAVWGQFSFRQFLIPAYTSQGLQAPSSVVSANYRVLICCTCHFQSSSLFVYFGFLCLHVSSVSNFYPDTRGQRWSLILAHLFSRAVGREEHCKQISLACMRNAHNGLGYTGFPPAHGMCAFPVYTAQAPGCSAGELSKAGPGLWCFPGLSRSGSGSWVLHKDADSVGPAFCDLPRSEQLR